MIFWMLVQPLEFTWKASKQETYLALTARKSSIYVILESWLMFSVRDRFFLCHCYALSRALTMCFSAYYETRGLQRTS
jgi:hypothetical protein